MTDLEFCKERIEHHRKRLKECEKKYHRAVLYGTSDDMKSALADCQFFRAKIIEYVARRDELTGGDNHAKNQC